MESQAKGAVEVNREQTVNRVNKAEPRRWWIVKEPSKCADSAYRLPPPHVSDRVIEVVEVLAVNEPNPEPRSRTVTLWMYEPLDMPGGVRLTMESGGPFVCNCVLAKKEVTITEGEGIEVLP